MAPKKTTTTTKKKKQEKKKKVTSTMLARKSEKKKKEQSLAQGKLTVSTKKEELYSVHYFGVKRGTFVFFKCDK